MGLERVEAVFRPAGTIMPRRVLRVWSPSGRLARHPPVTPTLVDHVVIVTLDGVRIEEMSGLDAAIVQSTLGKDKKIERRRRGALRRATPERGASAYAFSDTLMTAHGSIAGTRARQPRAITNRHRFSYPATRNFSPASRATIDRQQRRIGRIQPDGARVPEGPAAAQSQQWASSRRGPFN